jgi:hypothetical protein
MDGALFIDDGFTLTDSLPAVPGLHPAAEMVYRPALARERAAYSAKMGAKDPDALDRYENELIARQTVSVNEQPVDKEKARRLHPVVRTRLIDLILSFTAAKQREAEGKSEGA